MTQHFNENNSPDAETQHLLSGYLHPTSETAANYSSIYVLDEGPASSIQGGGPTSPIPRSAFVSGTSVFVPLGPSDMESIPVSDTTPSTTPTPPPIQHVIEATDWAKIKKASIPVGIISVVLVSFIFILIVAPTVLATQSPIVLTFNQSIRNSDTTPLILTADDHLPRYYNLDPYNNVTVELVNHLYDAEVVYVRGANACDPLPGHVTSEVVDPVPLPLSPSDPILIKGNQYYPQGSTLQGRLNITAGGNERGNFTLCLVRSQVTSEPQDLVCFRSANYSIIANKSVQLNYTISTLGYFDVYLMATASIEVDYWLNITYWYYNIQDYSNSILCRITSNNEFRSCTFLLYPEDIGCLIAHLDQEVSIPRYETFRVHLIRDMKAVYIVVAVCAVLVIFCAIALTVVLVCCCVLWYKGKFKTEFQQV